MMSDRHSPEDIAYAEEAGANVFLRLPSPSRALKSLAEHLAPLFDGRTPQSERDVHPLRPTDSAAPPLSRSRPWSRPEPTQKPTTRRSSDADATMASDYALVRDARRARRCARRSGTGGSPRSSSCSSSP